MIKTDETFKKKHRVRNSKDFKKIQNRGKKQHSRFFTFIYSPGRTRIGLTVSTKVGNSPTRNYIKRCIREYFRKNKILFTDVDLVIIVKPELSCLKYEQIALQLNKLLRKCK